MSAEYLVMTDAHSHACLKVEVGAKFTTFISRDTKNVDLRRLPNAEFERRYVWEWRDHTPAKFAESMFRTQDYGVMVTRRARAHLILFYKEPSMAAPTPTKTKPVPVAVIGKVVNPGKAAEAGTVTASKPEAAGDAKPRARKIENQKIRLLVKDNPKRPSSNAFQIFALYAENKTTDEFLAAGGTSAALRYDVEHGFIELY